MTLPKRYNPRTAEPQLQARWQQDGRYHFDPTDDSRPVYSIDTPPPTVSGNLHLGHVYSYSQTDFIARFWRMNGYNLFYPMGFDDNGLPTERLVERTEGIRAQEIGREAFIERCLAVSEEAEKAYKDLWLRLGLSVDWRYSYRSIDERSRRIAQISFLELVEQGLAYRKEAPTIWCPECQTAIAQAELDDLERETIFYTLAFTLPNGETLPIATTRPELLPACVAIFVHPEDGRFTPYLNQTATIPLFGRTVPILADPQADPEKGSGAVMCCTFGDTTDVAWWHTHGLPLIELLGKDGRLTAAAGEFAGLSTSEARQAIIAAIDEAGLLLSQSPTAQAVRTHERCDTPVEYIVTSQWFINLLDHKEALLAAGAEIAWQPAHMESRYRQWVENLSWDWCISRQRYFGVTFPVWYCEACGETTFATREVLPLDPTTRSPQQPCAACGATQFRPETDVMDTWATSSMSPQIVGGWLEDEALFDKVFPFSLRPQAHEIIRTWAFYTIAKSHFHMGKRPFQTIGISGWALAPAGMGKISKSRGGGPVAPLTWLEQYSADALRYWSASTGLGKDATISEEKVQAGAKLVNKLWNVARFASRFLEGVPLTRPATLSLADRWLLGQTAVLINRTTQLFRNADYATAKSEIETFFWRDLADNYLEMAKMRLYDDQNAGAEGARYALYHALLATCKLFAPILPHVTERIYLALFAEDEGQGSIHTAVWPTAEAWWLDEAGERALAGGAALVEIATAVRRFKSERNLSLGAELTALTILGAPDDLAAGKADLQSITRAKAVGFSAGAGERLLVGKTAVGELTLFIQP